MSVLLTMRILAYYITGAVLGAGLALGIWWALPLATHADRSEVEPTSAVQTADLNQVTNALDQSRHNAITRAVRQVAPAVVGINVIQIREVRQHRSFFDDPFFSGLYPERVYRQQVENLGSGFLISPDGYVLTNEHVIHSGTKIVVTTTAGEKFDAEVVGFDYSSDIALLKIDGEDFPYIEFGDSDDVIIGEWAIALGNPFGLFEIHSQPTVTVGVVSATDRDFDTTRVGRNYRDMIQTDAAINQGNSGGPLVNSLARLIGMNTMIFSQSGGNVGVGFAIPSNELVEITSDLKARERIDRDFWIGLAIQNINWRMAVQLGLREVRGVIVTEVESGSPAETAGIKPSDVILGINRQQIVNSRSIYAILQQTDLRVGDRLQFTIFDGKKVRDVTLELGKKGV